MKKQALLALCGLLLSAGTWAASGMNYNGTNLALNNEFTRTQCGTTNKDELKEISGLACSRTTPGYLWAHGDENTGNNKKIVALTPSGSLTMTVKISNDQSPMTNKIIEDNRLLILRDNKTYTVTGQQFK